MVKSAFGRKPCAQQQLHDLPTPKAPEGDACSKTKNVHRCIEKDPQEDKLTDFFALLQKCKEKQTAQVDDTDKIARRRRSSADITELIESLKNLPGGSIAYSDPCSKPRLRSSPQSVRVPSGYPMFCSTATAPPPVTRGGNCVSRGTTPPLSTKMRIPEANVLASKRRKRSAVTALVTDGTQPSNTVRMETPVDVNTTKCHGASRLHRPQGGTPQSRSTTKTLSSTIFGKTRLESQFTLTHNIKRALMDFGCNRNRYILDKSKPPKPKKNARSLTVTPALGRKDAKKVGRWHSVNLIAKEPGLCAGNVPRKAKDGRPTLSPSFPRKNPLHSSLACLDTESEGSPRLSNLSRSVFGLPRRIASCDPKRTGASYAHAFAPPSPLERVPSNTGGPCEGRPAGTRDAPRSTVNAFDATGAPDVCVTLPLDTTLMKDAACDSIINNGRTTTSSASEDAVCDECSAWETPSTRDDFIDTTPSPTDVAPIDGSMCDDSLIVYDVPCGDVFVIDNAVSLEENARRPDCTAPGKPGTRDDYAAEEASAPNTPRDPRGNTPPTWDYPLTDASWLGAGEQDLKAGLSQGCAHDSPVRGESPVAQDPIPPTNNVRFAPSAFWASLQHPASPCRVGESVSLKQPGSNSGDAAEPSNCLVYRLDDTFSVNAQDGMVLCMPDSRVTPVATHDLCCDADVCRVSPALPVAVTPVESSVCATIDLIAATPGWASTTVNFMPLDSPHVGECALDALSSTVTLTPEIPTCSPRSPASLVDTDDEGLYDGMPMLIDPPEELAPSPRRPVATLASAPRRKSSGDGTEADSAIRGHITSALSFALSILPAMRKNTIANERQNDNYVQATPSPVTELAAACGSPSQAPKAGLRIPCLTGSGVRGAIAPGHSGSDNEPTPAPPSTGYTLSHHRPVSQHNLSDKDGPGWNPAQESTAPPFFTRAGTRRTGSPFQATMPLCSPEATTSLEPHKPSPGVPPSHSPTQENALAPVVGGNVPIDASPMDCQRQETADNPSARESLVDKELFVPAAHETSRDAAHASTVTPRCMPAGTSEYPAHTARIAVGVPVSSTPPPGGVASTPSPITPNQNVYNLVLKFSSADLCEDGRVHEGNSDPQCAFVPMVNTPEATTPSHYTLSPSHSFASPPFSFISTASPTLHASTPVSPSMSPSYPPTPHLEAHGREQHCSSIDPASPCDVPFLNAHMLSGDHVLKPEAPSQKAEPSLLAEPLTPPLPPQGFGLGLGLGLGQVVQPTRLSDAPSFHTYNQGVHLPRSLTQENSVGLVGLSAPPGLHYGSQVTPRKHAGKLLLTSHGDDSFFKGCMPPDEGNACGALRSPSHRFSPLFELREAPTAPDTIEQQAPTAHDARLAPPAQLSLGVELPLQIGNSSGFSHLTLASANPAWSPISSPVGPYDIVMPAAPQRTPNPNPNPNPKPMSSETLCAVKPSLSSETLCAVKPSLSTRASPPSSVNKLSMPRNSAFISTQQQQASGDGNSVSPVRERLPEPLEMPAARRRKYFPAVREGARQRRSRRRCEDANSAADGHLVRRVSRYFPQAHQHVRQVSGEANPTVQSTNFKHISEPERVKSAEYFCAQQYRKNPDLNSCTVGGSQVQSGNRFFPKVIPESVAHVESQDDRTPSHISVPSWGLVHGTWDLRDRSHSISSPRAVAAEQMHGGATALGNQVAPQTRMYPLVTRALDQWRAGGAESLTPMRAENALDVLPVKEGTVKDLERNGKSADEAGLERGAVDQKVTVSSQRQSNVPAKEESDVTEEADVIQGEANSAYTNRLVRGLSVSPVRYRPGHQELVHQVGARAVMQNGGLSSTLARRVQVLVPQMANPPIPGHQEKHQYHSSVSPTRFPPAQRKVHLHGVCPIGQRRVLHEYPSNVPGVQRSSLGAVEPQRYVNPVVARQLQVPMNATSYHARQSHENVSPARLLRRVQCAEAPANWNPSSQCWMTGVGTANTTNAQYGCFRLSSSHSSASLLF